jgi:hypothetical protein
MEQFVTQAPGLRSVPGLYASDFLDTDSRAWAGRTRATGRAATDAHQARRLAGRVTRESDPVVVDALFEGLCRIGGQPAVDALLPLLRSANPLRRHGASWALFRLAEATGARIESLLDNRDPQVRAFAVDALAELPHRDVPRWLITVMRTDDAPEVVVQALECSIEAGVPIDAQTVAGVRARFGGEPAVEFALELALDAAQRGFPR